MRWVDVVLNLWKAKAIILNSGDSQSRFIGPSWNKPITYRKGDLL